MFWVCLTCGTENNEANRTCMCGYRNDGSVIVQSGETDAMHALKEGRQISEKSFLSKDADKILSQVNSDTVKGEKPMKTGNVHNGKPAGGLVIKEVDSWKFTYSQPDKCICLGTPALKAFSLKLTERDLEELLEYLYLKTGKEKTLRKLNLSIEEIPDLIDMVDSMIEKKKSKISLEFTSGEFQSIVDFINRKLKE